MRARAFALTLFLGMTFKRYVPCSFPGAASRHNLDGGNTANVEVARPEAVLEVRLQHEATVGVTPVPAYSVRWTRTWKFVRCVSRSFEEWTFNVAIASIQCRLCEMFQIHVCILDRSAQSTCILSIPDASVVIDMKAWVLDSGGACVAGRRRASYKVDGCNTLGCGGVGVRRCTSSWRLVSSRCGASGSVRGEMPAHLSCGCRRA